jgi:hypothetical protein
MCDKVILGLPFIAALYPFSVDDTDIITNIPPCPNHLLIEREIVMCE